MKTRGKWDHHAERVPTGVQYGVLEHETPRRSNCYVIPTKHVYNMKIYEGDVWATWTMFVCGWCVHIRRDKEVCHISKFLSLILPSNSMQYRAHACLHTKSPLRSDTCKQSQIPMTPELLTWVYYCLPKTLAPETQKRPSFSNLQLSENRYSKLFNIHQSCTIFRNLHKLTRFGIRWSILFLFSFVWQVCLLLNLPIIFPFSAGRVSNLP